MRRSPGWAIGVGAVLGWVGMPVASCSSSSSQPGQLGGNTVDATAETGKETGPETGHEAEAAPEAGPASDGGCDGGLSLCSGLCTNTQTDPNNCNKCGNACGSGVSCVAGVCQCNQDAGQTLCTTASGSTCVDTLADPNNCGACAHICQVQATNTCSNGYCQPAVVAAPNAPIWDIAVNATTIYWTQPFSGSNSGEILMKDFAAGSTVVTLFQNLGDPRGIALDLNNIYWVNYGSTDVDQYKILGGEVATEWPVYGDAGAIPPTYAQPLAVAVDGSYIYWVANAAGDVLRVPIGSAGTVAPTILQSGESNPVAIAVDGNNVYWCDQGTSTNPANGSVRQKAKDGSGSAITLAGSEPSPWSIAVDANNVYWTDQVNPGFVKQITIGQTTGAKTLAQNEGAPYGIAIDGTSVYWTDNDDNTVNKVPIGGGAKFQYAVQQANPAAITVDQKNIYWVNHASGQILEVTK